MKILNQKLVAIAAPLAMTFGLAIAPNVATAGYLVDSQGKMVLDNYKECWVWQKPGMDAICGDEMPKKEEPMTRAITPVYGDKDGDGVKDNIDRCPNSKTTQVDANGCALDTDKDGVANYLDKCPSTKAGLKVDPRGCHIIENITLKIGVDGFDFDSARLRPTMMTALDSVATKVKASAGNETLSVIGHTDSRGSETYNQGLSERRASSVVDYLAGKGITRSSMSASGMGESSPVGDNKSSEGRAENRRVEIQTR